MKKPPLLTNTELADKISELIDYHELAHLSLEQPDALPAARRVLRMMDNNLSELLDYYSELERAEAVSASTPELAPVNPDGLTKSELLDIACNLQSMSKVLAEWLCNSARQAERGDIEPDDGDMLAIACLLVRESKALVAAVDNVALVVEVRG